MQYAKDLIEECIEYNQKILIVPGGGIFADIVRMIKTSQEAAHWMAILCMEEYAYYLKDISVAKPIYDLDIDDKGVFILFPYNLIRKYDPVPHTWKATSDTIAAWIASKLDARFIKATDVNGIYLNGKFRKEVYASEIIGIETCVDMELPLYLMKNKMNCEIINGTQKGNLKKCLKYNEIGTLIKG